MKFIWFITDECAARRFLRDELQYAFVTNHNDHVILELEVFEKGDIEDSFTIKTFSYSDNKKAYDKVCEAIIKNSNVIDMRGINCKIFNGEEEL